MENNDNNKKVFFAEYLSKILAAFIVIALSISFFFLIFKINIIFDFIIKVIGILQPIIYGLVIAYLLNPLISRMEDGLSKQLGKRFKNEKKVQAISRNISILIALVVLIIFIIILGMMVLPQLYVSISGLIKEIPAYTNSLQSWLDKLLKNRPDLTQMFNIVIEKLNEYLKTWLETGLLTRINSLVGQFAVIVMNILGVVINLIIGLIVTFYTINSREVFKGQSKKIIYAIMSPEHANGFLNIVRQSDKIFSGFIIGKLIDSLIIGIICFVCLLALDMPYTLLVSVIVGVTNIIPFFGPYIGAVPSAFLILLVNPLKGLYFIIFIIILQQVDGNIIGPKILGDSTGLSAFWVLFAILIGGGLFGLVGMIIGVPCFAVIYFIIKTLIEAKLRTKGLPTDSTSYVSIENADLNKEKTE